MKPSDKAHLEILRQEYLRRASQTKKYTLRNFAIDLDLSPSTLSEFVNSKKRLSQKTALKVAEALRLNRLDTEIFLTSLMATKPGIKKITAEKRLKQLMQKKQTFKLQEKELQFADSWHHFAILELLALKINSYETIATSLELPIDDVKRALELLTNLGWVKKINAEYICTFDSSDTTDDVPSATIKKYHQSVLNKSQDVLHKLPVNEREFQSVTLTFNKDEMLEAKEMIRAFVDQFCDRFGNTANKKNVCQLAVQFYGVSK